MTPIARGRGTDHEEPPPEAMLEELVREARLTDEAARRLRSGLVSSADLVERLVESGLATREQVHTIRARLLLRGAPPPEPVGDSLAAALAKRGIETAESATGATPLERGFAALRASVEAGRLTVQDALSCLRESRTAALECAACDAQILIKGWLEGRRYYCPACKKKLDGSPATDILAFRTRPLVIDDTALDLAAAVGTVLGRWEILERTGEGGTSVVFRARDLDLGRPVALKVLRLPEVGGEPMQRFLREARVLAALDHPGIVRVYEAGVARGHAYLVLEWVDGTSLAGSTRPGMERALEIVEKVALACAAAHRAGIVHCDLKPENILLDARGEPRILDFGISRLAEATTRLTATGTILGTPPYMAPEQLEPRRARVDVRTDVYALGATLFYLLTGRPPFTSETIAALHEEILHRPPDLPDYLPRDLRNVLLRCLEKRPAQRYPDAEALAADLRALRESRKPLGAAPGLRTAIRRWVQRHPRQAKGGLVLCFLALLAFLASAVRSALRAERIEAALARVEALLREHDQQATRVPAAPLRLAELLREGGEQLELLGDVSDGRFFLVRAELALRGGTPADVIRPLSGLEGPRASLLRACAMLLAGDAGGARAELRRTERSEDPGLSEGAQFALRLLDGQDAEPPASFSPLLAARLLCRLPRTDRIPWLRKAAAIAPGDPQTVREFAREVLQKGLRDEALLSEAISRLRALEDPAATRDLVVPLGLAVLELQRREDRLDTALAREIRREAEAGGLASEALYACAYLASEEPVLPPPEPPGKDAPGSAAAWGSYLVAQYEAGRIPYGEARAAVAADDPEMRTLFARLTAARLEREGFEPESHRRAIEGVGGDPPRAPVLYARLRALEYRLAGEKEETYADARASLENALRIDPSNVALLDAYMVFLAQRLNRAFREGRPSFQEYRRLRELFEQRVRLGKPRAAPYVRMGEVAVGMVRHLLRAGNVYAFDSFVEAERNAREALRIEPDSVPAHSLAARMYAVRVRLQAGEAQADWEGFRWALEHVDRVHRAGGESNDLFQELAELVPLLAAHADLEDPDNGPRFAEAGIVLRRARSGGVDLRPAAAELLRALERRPSIPLVQIFDLLHGLTEICDDPELEGGVGALEAERGETSALWERAVARLTRVIDRAGERWDRLGFRGLAHFRLGRRAEAVRDLERSCELDPERARGRGFPDALERARGAGEER